MAKKIQQVRYYQQGDSRNQPAGLAMNHLASGSVFNGYYPIVQLGIQSLPGLKFYLNNGTSPIILGYTGIYDLELDGMTEITKLQFDAKSLNLINANPDSYLIVDFIYESED